MSTGFTGAIDEDGKGDLSVHYAIAATYRVQPGWVNKITVNCKRCGTQLLKGVGTCVVVTSINGLNPSSPFFCPPCTDWARKSSEKVMERQIKDARRGK
jgi:hypothetical protein